MINYFLTCFIQIPFQLSNVRHVFTKRIWFHVILFCLESNMGCCWLFKLVLATTVDHIWIQRCARVKNGNVKSEESILWSFIDFFFCKGASCSVLNKMLCWIGAG